jgi:diguanylate cyclase (GGDEF)-like protein
LFINNPRSHERTPEPGAPSEIEQLRTLLYTDDLTGLYNRRFFRHCIAEQKAQSDSAGIPFALVMMDVDHFKQINDSKGHAVGDQVLIQIAGVLREELRDRGWVFRYAGDEFVALLRNTTEEHVRTFCTRMLQKISELSNTPTVEVESLSISIGYSVYPNATRAIGDLLESADRALYVSKRAGRNSAHSAQETVDQETHKSIDWPFSVSCPTLVGRQQQWNQLQHHFFECRNGHGRLIFLTGEAGIGKSRLIHHYVRRQRASDYHILLGECSEATIVHSYGPIRDALKKGFEAKDPATVNVYKELGESYRRVLMELVPQFDRFEKAQLSSTPSSDRYFLLESIFLLLQGLSRQLPTALILEDIHWSDEATISLVQFLAKNIQKERILLIVTLREEEATNTVIPTILENLSRENLYEKIELEPLTLQETNLMVHEIFRGYPVSPDLQQWIYSEAEGIPFYVEELLKLLIEEEYLEKNAQGIRLRIPDKFILPYSIRALIQRRIRRLNEPSRKLLGLASIIGNEFDLKTLVRLTGENEGQLLDILEELVRLDIIREMTMGGVERFNFRHNKIRDVIYDEMGQIRRKKYHYKVAEILEELHGNEVQIYAEDLAYHYEQSEETAKAGFYSLIAGKKALQIHAYVDACNHFRRCFQYSQYDQNPSTIFSPDQLVELYTNHGMALESLGRWDDAVESYDSLFRIENTSSSVRVNAWNHLCRLFYKRENFPKSLSMAESAIQMARSEKYTAGICKSHQNMGLVHWRISQYAKALEHMDAALAMTEPETEQKSKLLNSRGIILLEQGNYEQARMSFNEALQISQKTNNNIGIIESLVNMSLIEHLLGKLHDARQRLIRAFALAQESADPISIAACCVNQAELEFKLANYELGKRLNEKAGSIYEELGHSHGITYFLENQAHLAMIQGHLEEALETTRNAANIAQQKILRKRKTELLRNEANLCYLLGFYEDEFRILDQMTTQCSEIDDRAGVAESLYWKGLSFMRLGTLQNACDHMKRITELPDELLSAELHFLKISALAFLSCIERRESDLMNLQRELKKIADGTDYAYLMIGTPLLCVHQMTFLDRFPEALRFAEDAERQALYYNQDVWLPRVRLKIYELQKILRRAPAIPKVYALLDLAKSQKQNHIVHGCYQLLWEIDPQFERLQKDWRVHWESWHSQIPEAYRESLRPASEDSY